MSGQRQQGWVETDDAALPLKDGTLQIVVKGDPRHATPGREGPDMPTQEILHVGAEISVGRSAVSRTGRQRKPSTAGGPCRFQDGQSVPNPPAFVHRVGYAQEGFTLGSRSMASDQVAEVIWLVG